MKQQFLSFAAPGTQWVSLAGMTPDNCRRVAQSLAILPALAALALLCLIGFAIASAKADAAVVVLIIAVLSLTVMGIDPFLATLLFGISILLIEWKLFRAAYLTWFRWSPLALGELTAAIFFFVSLIVSVAVLVLVTAAIPEDRHGLSVFGFAACIAFFHVLYRLASKPIRHLAFPPPPPGDPASATSDEKL